MGSTILLADKSVTIQKIVQLTFADDNYTIQCVSDGQAAIDAIPQIHPDLILADISLPLRTGYDVCRMLRTDPSLGAYSGTPVILLAGIYETMDEDRLRQVEERVREVRANGFLSKPFDPQLLTVKVKELMPRAEPEGINHPEAASVSDMFAETQPTAQMGAVEDSERTMMIPGPAFSASNIFAEASPFAEEVEEEAQPEPPRPPVDIDAITPAYEPVFDADEIPSEEGQKIESTESQYEAGSAFRREETEFDMEPSQPPHQPQREEFVEGPTLILPSAEEPFGDVFDTPSGPEWTAAPVSEEETPFGMPEPPASVEAPAVIEQEPQQEAEPALGIETVVMATEQVEESKEEAGIVEADASQQEYFEDTWPGLPPAQSGQPHVEELFESEEAAPAEETGRLESAAEITLPAVEEEQIPAVSAAPVPAAPVEMTEELLERIAEKVVAKLSERVVSEIVWQVVPDLAEKMIRRELEKLHAGEES